jgi:hypothetical protein
MKNGTLDSIQKRIEEGVGDDKITVIDTIKYNEMSRELVYVALWSRTEMRGYGGCCLTKEEFEKLQERYVSRLDFIQHA